MDYDELAAELLDKMQAFHKARPQKHFNEALQGEEFVLRYISLRGGDVLPGEISTEMSVSSARIATALNSLEKKGLVTRQIDKNDRRKIIIGITQKGKDLAEKQYHIAVSGIAKILVLLGDHDAKEYVRIMSKLAEILPKHKIQM